MSGKKIPIRISMDGTITFVHDDSLTNALKKHGVVNIKRASNVEPDSNCNWTADLTPSGGPVLSGIPSREEAIALEVDWIHKNVIKDSVTQ